MTKRPKSLTLLLWSPFIVLGIALLWGKVVAIGSVKVANVASEPISGYVRASGRVYAFPETPPGGERRVLYWMRGEAGPSLVIRSASGRERCAGVGYVDPWLFHEHRFEVSRDGISVDGIPARGHCG